MYWINIPIWLYIPAFEEEAIRRKKGRDCSGSGSITTHIPGAASTVTYNL
ncbi:MAG: hypothetical protein KDC34_18735 [Saprospiraceae bacterium]|nr:hypothetical protein [Saprospiraceae bacterium]